MTSSLLILSFWFFVCWERSSSIGCLKSCQNHLPELCTRELIVCEELPMVDLTKSRAKCGSTEAVSGDELDGVVDEYIETSSQSDDELIPAVDENEPTPSNRYLFFFLFQLYLLFTLISGMIFLFTEYVIANLSEYFFSFSSDYAVYCMQAITIILFAVLGHSSWSSFKDEEVELLSVFQHYLIQNRYPPTDFLYHLLYFYALPHMFLSVCIGFLLASFLTFQSFIFLSFCYLIILIPLRYIRRKMD